MPKGFARTQSQPSIHSPSPRERGLGLRQGYRNKDTPSFKLGCLQVGEQSRCRTHRQQTTTVAQMQSPQSVLKEIENKLHFSKIDFFYNLSVLCMCRTLIFVPQLLTKNRKINIKAVTVTATALFV